MLDQHGQPIEQKTTQAERTPTPGHQLSSADYVNEVTRHLSRMRQTSAANVGARRI